MVKMAVQSLVILLPVEEQDQFREDNGDLSDGQVTRVARVPLDTQNLETDIDFVETKANHVDEPHGVADIIEIEDD